MFVKQVAVPLALALLATFQLGRQFENAHQNKQKKRKVLRRIPSKTHTKTS
jgi:hypothetical protein